MKCRTRDFLFILTFISYHVEANEANITQKLHDFAGEMETLKSLHDTDFMRISNDIQNLKNTIQRNCRPGFNEAELYEETTTTESPYVSDQEGDPSNFYLAKKMQVHEKVTRTQSSINHMKNEIDILKTENRRLHKTLAEISNQVAKLTKEMKVKEADELGRESYNDVLEPESADTWERRAHKLRHRHMSADVVFRVAHAQDRLEERANAMQAQIRELKTRLDRYQAPNWNLLSATVDVISLEHKVFRKELDNASHKLSDFDKVHASMLELREDVENIENKADKTIPEIRKEISKLEINYAQLNAASSYLKEDQENLRQSVKAIAVSVSNAVDRAEQDRSILQSLNESVSVLRSHTKQHFHQLNNHILKSESSRDFNETGRLPVQEVLVDVTEVRPTVGEYQELVEQFPRDCSALSGPPGVYLLRPGRTEINAWCTNGTTLMQRRYNGSVDFNRNFREYQRGFGDAFSEYWLGLDAIHLISADNCSSMRIDMTDIFGEKWYAQYEHFYISGADTGYVLHVSGFEGNASDALEYQNHMEFSTVDHDRDISDTHCARSYEGGWWFSHCQHVNLNGRYTLGLTWFDATRNEWIAVASSEMRLYRRPGCL